MNRPTRTLFALWILVAGCAGSPQPCAADDGDTSVTLRGEITVQSMIVRLSDVFNGIPKDNDRAIAQSPAPGKQVTYDINVLTRVAEQYHLDWKPQSLADHIVVTTACSRITGDMLRDAVAAKMKETARANGTLLKGSVDVAFDNRSPQIDLPVDHMPAYTVSNFQYDPTNKRFQADLVAQTDGGPSSFPISGHLTLKHMVPVLARRLEGGTVVTADDLDQVEIPEERVNSTVISDASQLIGRELRRDTDSGEIMHVRDIVPPRFVTRGGLVTLKIETPFMLLTAQGKAMQDGAQGDVVRVTNTESNRLVEGTVEGPGVVRIRTSPQKLAEAQ